MTEIIELAENDDGCYLKRADVRAILIGVADEDIEIAESFLAEIDVLQIFSRSDFIADNAVDAVPAQGAQCKNCRHRGCHLAWRCDACGFNVGLPLPVLPAEGQPSEVERLLKKISDLAYDEDVGEPLDDAIGYANKALAVIASRFPAASADGQASSALDDSQSLLAMIYHLGTEFAGIDEQLWSSEGLTELLAEQIKENRVALNASSQSPAASAEGVSAESEYERGFMSGYEQAGCGFLATSDGEASDRMKQLVTELKSWPATGRGNGLDAVVVRKLMKRASRAIIELAFRSSAAGAPAEEADDSEVLDFAASALAAERICDCMDDNLSKWDGVGEGVPQGAVDLYETAKKLRDLLAPHKKATPRLSPAASDSGSDLTKIAAECHRAKWQFDATEEHPLPVKDARKLVDAAFNALHRIGDMAMNMRDEARGRSQPEAGDKTDVSALVKYAQSLEAELDRLRAQVEKLTDELDRTLRNRDMWKSQCERQADQLRKFSVPSTNSQGAGK